MRQVLVCIWRSQILHIRSNSVTTEKQIITTIASAIDATKGPLTIAGASRRRLDRKDCDDWQLAQDQVTSAL